MGNIKEFILKKLESAFPNYLKLGDEQLIKKKYAKAIEFYIKAEPVHNKNHYLYYNWAAALYALGKYDEAIDKFKLTVHINPEFSDAHCNWGLALMNKGRLREAVSKFKQASKLNPNDPKIFLNYGLVLEQLNYSEDATKMYNKVIDLVAPESQNSCDCLDQNFIMALNQLALQNIKREKYLEASYKYEKIVRLDPIFSPGYYNLAICYAKINKPAEAVECLKAAIVTGKGVLKRAKTEPAFKVLEFRPDYKEIIS